jgi:hypothetical protein
LDVDLRNTDINVTVAKPVQDMKTKVVGKLVAGQPGQIVCDANGGRPAPMISLEITKPLPEFLNDTQTQTPGNIFYNLLGTWGLGQLGHLGS